MKVTPLLPFTISQLNAGAWTSINGKSFAEAYTWNGELVCGVNAACFGFRFCAKINGTCSSENELFTQRIGFAKPISPQ